MQWIEHVRTELCGTEHISLSFFDFFHPPFCPIACVHTHREVLTERGEIITCWPMAWEEVYLNMTSFLPREHVEKVPWRRTKVV